MFGIGAWIAGHGILGPLWRMLKAVPWWVYVIAAVLLIGWRVHSGIEQRAHDAAYNEAYTLQQGRIDQWKAASAINLASIDELQRLLKAKNDESDQRAKAYAASRAQDAQDVAAADQRLRATTSQIARLRGIADHAGANPTCKVPDALTAALEGL